MKIENSKIMKENGIFETDIVYKYEVYHKQAENILQLIRYINEYNDNLIFFVHVVPDVHFQQREALFVNYGAELCAA